MICVRVEIWPGGDETRKREIGVGYIALIGGATDSGDYDVRLMKSTEYSSSPGIWKRGQVQRFPRLKLGPWDLLFRALADCVGSRNRGVSR